MCTFEIGVSKTSDLQLPMLIEFHSEEAETLLNP